MDNQRSMDVFSKAPVPRAVFKNALPAMAAMLMVLVYHLADTFFIGQTHDALQAMGAATASLVTNLSRQGIIFIPALFILKAILGLTGLIWAQPVADILSIALAAILYINTFKKLSRKQIVG
ncbi:hypothetical protein AALB64_11645 [Lachnospiraceae bacterium 45-P1]